MCTNVHARTVSRCPHTCAHTYMGEALGVAAKIRDAGMWAHTCGHTYVKHMQAHTYVHVCTHVRTHAHVGERQPRFWLNGAAWAKCATLRRLSSNPLHSTAQGGHR